MQLPNRNSNPTDEIRQNAQIPIENKTSSPIQTGKKIILHVTKFFLPNIHSSKYGLKF